MVYVTEVDGELRGEGTGGELGERESSFVVFGWNPGSSLDQVAAHGGDEGDGSAEAERAELDEVSGE
ncbi:MAG: hypothetical protein HC933_13395 [Pleurocapsa sp. SU_196_0]|nr:hypothetical protein [Pleurocapsa sp. SU_196_0]